MDNKLVGFIFEHEDDDYSLVSIELSENDRNTIETILSNYTNSGCSVRGDSGLQLKEIV